MLPLQRSAAVTFLCRLIRVSASTDVLNVRNLHPLRAGMLRIEAQVQRVLDVASQQRNRPPLLRFQPSRPDLICCQYLWGGRRARGLLQVLSRKVRASHWQIRLRVVSLHNIIDLLMITMSHVLCPVNYRGRRMMLQTMR